jgi:hypothetical protein
MYASTELASIGFAAYANCTGQRFKGIDVSGLIYGNDNRERDKMLRQVRGC